MKKLFLALMVVATAVFFSSCGKTTLVTLTVTPDSNITAGPGQVVTFTVVLTPDGINGGTVGSLDVADGNGTSIYTKNYSNSANTVTDTVEYTIPNDATIGSTISINFTATDGASGKTSTVSATISVGTTVPTLVTSNGVAPQYVSTTLNNQMIMDLTSTGVTLNGGSYTDGELAFVWQDTYGYSICSPNAQWIHDLFSANSINYTTADKQNTEIMKYNGTWSSLTADSLNNITVVSENLTGGGNGVQGLTAGDIVVYKTQDGRKGALLVNTNSKVTKNMNADLKYQESASSAK